RHTRSKRDWSSDVCSSDLLAGLRLGTIVSQEQNINSCRKIISPFSVNVAALCAGIASLNDTEYENFVKEQTIASRDALFEGLCEIGRASCRERGEDWEVTG